MMSGAGGAGEKRQLPELREGATRRAVTPKPVPVRFTRGLGRGGI